MYPPVRTDSSFWTWPTPNKFRLLRVTSRVTALCRLHSTQSHQLSIENCSFRIFVSPNHGGQRGRPNMGDKSAVLFTLRMRSQFRAMQRVQARAVAVPQRIHPFGLTAVALGPDMFATATRSGTRLGIRVHPPLPAGPLRSLQLELGPPRRQGLSVDCVPFAPTTSAQSTGPLDHSTTEETSPRADFESWFRRAARGTVERVPGACVSAETTTRRDFLRKPVVSRSLLVTLLIAPPSSLHAKRTHVHTVRSGRVRPASVCGRVCISAGLTTPSMPCPSHLERSVPCLCSWSTAVALLVWPTFR